MSSKNPQKKQEQNRSGVKSGGNNMGGMRQQQYIQMQSNQMPQSRMPQPQQGHQNFIHITQIPTNQPIFVPQPHGQIFKVQTNFQQFPQAYQPSHQFSAPQPAVYPFYPYPGAAVAGNAGGAQNYHQPPLSYYQNASQATGPPIVQRSSYVPHPAPIVQPQTLSHNVQAQQSSTPQQTPPALPPQTEQTAPPRPRKKKLLQIIDPNSGELILPHTNRSSSYSSRESSRPQTPTFVPPPTQLKSTEPPLPPPKQEFDIGDSVKNIFKEFESVRKLDYDWIRQLFPGDQIVEFVDELSRQVCDFSKEIKQKAAGVIIKLIIENKLITKAQVIKSFASGVLMELSDIEIDVPKAPSYFAMFLIEAFLEEEDLSWLLSLGESMSEEYPSTWASLVTHTLNTLKHRLSEEAVQVLYKKTNGADKLLIHLDSKFSYNNGLRTSEGAEFERLSLILIEPEDSTISFTPSSKLSEAKKVASDDDSTSPSTSGAIQEEEVISILRDSKDEMESLNENDDFRWN